MITVEQIVAAQHRDTPTLGLLNDKDVEFRLPAKTKSGTRFRFRRGGEEGRDLHLTVRATPEKSDGN